MLILPYDFCSGSGTNSAVGVEVFYFFVYSMYILNDEIILIKSRRGQTFANEIRRLKKNLLKVPKTCPLDFDIPIRKERLWHSSLNSKATIKCAYSKKRISECLSSERFVFLKMVPDQLDRSREKMLGKRFDPHTAAGKDI